MVDPRLRRIASVTRHYASLREGVTRAVWAPCVLAVAIIESFNSVSGPQGVVVGFSNIFGFVAVGFVLWMRANRWMDHRFGRVHSGKPLQQILGMNLWMFGYLAATRLDDSYGTGAGLPSARFLLIAAGGLWCCVRRWPYSVHYLLPAAIAFGAAIPFVDLRGEEAIELWEIKAFTATLLAWTAAGLIDLALLVKALPHRPQEPESVDAV